MDSTKNHLIKYLACSVARSTGNVNAYRRIRRFFSTERKADGVNCHGFTLFALGIDPSPRPRYIDPEIMEEFLYEGCFRSQMGNGTIIAFIEGRSDIAHTSVYIPTSQSPLLIQKKDIGFKYSIKTLEQVFEDDPVLKHETRIEFYKYMPKYGKIPSYFTSNA